jgi:hypothetical protein
MISLWSMQTGPWPLLWVGCNQYSVSAKGGVRERTLVFKRSLGNVGNGMQVKTRDCRCGTNSPKNVLGRAGRAMLSDASQRRFNAGNGPWIPCITVVSRSSCGPLSLRQRMRSRCSNAAMMLSIAPKGRDHIRIGKGGQICNISLIGVLSVRTRNSLRWIGDSDASTIYRHLRHTSTSVYHNGGSTLDSTNQ